MGWREKRGLEKRGGGGEDREGEESEGLISPIEVSKQNYGFVALVIMNAKTTQVLLLSQKCMD